MLGKVRLDWTRLGYAGFQPKRTGESGANAQAMARLNAISVQNLFSNSAALCVARRSVNMYTTVDRTIPTRKSVAS